MKVPLCIPDIGEEEIEAVKEVIKSGWLAHGPKTILFQEKFAEYIGTKHAVSCNSCASALQLAFMAKGIKGEVIVPSFTFPASANSIVVAGARPVFADIDYDTCNIDPKKIEEKITPNTKSIMPVHFAGQSCRMDEIMEIAEKHNLAVIEDSAECIGGTFKGKRTGTFGIGCFSFYPIKNMTTGEGGMITTDDEQVARKAATIGAHGVSTTALEREKHEKPWLRVAEVAGYNFRMSDILAAIGVVQLKKVEQMNDKRRAHAKYYSKNLQGNDTIDLPVEDADCKHVYQMYTIKVKGVDRTKFISLLKQNGVGASVHFDPPVHLHPFYKGYCKEGELPVTEKVSQTIVTLPMYPQIRKEELDHVISSIEGAIKSLK